MTTPDNGWTLLLVRRDGTGTRQLRSRNLLLALVGFGAVWLLVGVGAGRFWQSRTESEEVGVLQAEIDRLRESERQVGELAARLTEIEADYSRIQGALGSRDPRASTSLPLPFPGSLESRTLEAAGLPAWPLVGGGFITRAFGSPADGTRGGHPGVDIAVPSGSYVRAIQRGVVDGAGLDSVYGYFVRIAHPDATSSLYGHNAWLFAAVGDSVEQLEVIALSGNTGRSTAPHLHLEIRRDGGLIDPLSVVASPEGDRRSGTGRNR